LLFCLPLQLAVDAYTHESYQKLIAFVAGDAAAKNRQIIDFCFVVVNASAARRITAIKPVIDFLIGLSNGVAHA